MNTSDLFTVTSSIIKSKIAEDINHKQFDAFIFEGDCNDLMKSISSETIDLIISSPPYNIGKAYEKKTSLELYLRSIEPVIEQIYRVLSPKGSICWQVGNYVSKGEVFPLDIYFYRMFKSLGLKLRNRIIWRFGHGLHASKRFSGRYESILWFTKSENYTFNLDSVRIPAKYPGKRHYKGVNRGKPSGNPLGKNPSDVWDIVQHDWDTGIWEIPNIKSNHPEKTTHPCQFPVELVERCVLALTNKKDMVFDPYCGVGTALIAAIMHDRIGMGSELMPEYVDTAQDRLQRFKDGTLKIRPIGKPIHTPSGNEKVSQVPIEWGERN